MKKWLGGDIYSLRICTIAMFIVGLGMVMNYLDPINNWFERIGALVVILALITAARDLNQLEEMIRHQANQAYGDESYINDVLRPFIMSKPENFGLSSNPSQKEFEACIQLQANNATNAAIQEVKNRLRKVELTIGIIGTIIWGFGALFVKLLTWALNL